MSVETRVAIVTGGARGIGQGIAQRLGQDGFHVIVSDLPEQQVGIDETVTKITSAGGKATGVNLDVTDEASVDALVGQSIDAAGRLDVFVANAGIAQVKGLLEYSVDDFEKIMDVNVKGVFSAIAPPISSSSPKAGAAKLSARRRSSRSARSHCSGLTRRPSGRSVVSPRPR